MFKTPFLRQRRRRWNAACVRAAPVDVKWLAGEAATRRLHIMLIFHPTHSFYSHFSIKMHACMSNEMKSIIVKRIRACGVGMFVLRAPSDRGRMSKRKRWMNLAFRR